MKFLLDTHSFIWFIGGDLQLSNHARELMEDEKNELVISIASLWEMAIKYSLGKLSLEPSFEAIFPEQLIRNNIEVFDIQLEHLKTVAALPFHHRDPFDRLLIAQAQAEQMPIISADSIFDNYAVRREW